MKHGKRPTRKQRDIISWAKLKPDNWLIIKNITGVLHIKNRESGKVRIIVY